MLLGLALALTPSTPAAEAFRTPSNARKLIDRLHERTASLSVSLSVKHVKGLISAESFHIYGYLSQYQHENTPQWNEFEHLQLVSRTAFDHFPLIILSSIATGSAAGLGKPNQTTQ